MNQKLVKYERTQLLVMIVLSVTAPSRSAKADDSVDARKRLNADIEFLTFDAALEGRGLGRRGLDLAANYIGAQFGKCALNTAWYNGTPIQEFVCAATVNLGPNNRLALLGPPEDNGTREHIQLVLGLDYIPLAVGGSGSVESPLCFAGFGITDLARHYDDFGEIHVAGKTPIVFMGFDRHEMSEKLAKRVMTIKELNANAMIFVMNESYSRELVARYRRSWERRVESLFGQIKTFREMDSPTPREFDTQTRLIGSTMESINTYQERIKDCREHILSFESGGWDEVDPGYPIVRIRRSVIDRILESATGTDLMTLERQIDDDGKPRSRELPGWSLVGEVEVLREYTYAKNVIGVSEGVGSLADETIVVGAHYDASLTLANVPIPRRPPYDYPTFLGDSPVKTGPVSFVQGANDNASGVAVMLEVARSVAQLKQRPRRRIVFIAFAGEEIGMVGSRSYVSHPLFPNEKTVAMINLDMLGRLQNDRLVAIGAAPPGHFSQLLDNAKQQHGFQIDKSKVNSGGTSDQAPFHAKNIPTVWFSTGRDDTINSPKDRVERLNVDGMRRIAQLLTEFITALATDPKRPEFTK